MDQSGTGEVRCQNCGHENPADATYCENCGVRLRKDVNIPPQYPSTGEPQRHEPTNVAPSPYQQRPAEPPDEEWRMSNLGPPPQPKRRIWLWVLVGILIACVLICVVLFVLSYLLGSGNAPGWLQDAATNAAVRATKEAR